MKLRDLFESDNRRRQLERLAAQGDPETIARLEVERERSPNWEEQARAIRHEVMTVNKYVERLNNWNLDHDEFPEPYQPQVPYGADVAVKLQHAAQAARSSSYWNSSSQWSRSTDLYETKELWHNVVKDLAAEYKLSDLYRRPWIHEEWQIPEREVVPQPDPNYFNRNVKAPVSLMYTAEEEPDLDSMPQQEQEVDLNELL